MENQTMGTQIRRVRREGGFSQKELGRVLASAMRRSESYSQAAISDLENDKSPVTSEMLVHLSEIFQRSTSYFTGQPERTQISEQTSEEESVKKGMVLGNTDLLGIQDVGTGILLTFFPSRTDVQPYSVVLTRVPMSFVGAMNRVIGGGIDTYEYTGENFAGRVGAFTIGSERRPRCYVVIELPVHAIGYLIHLNLRSMVLFRDRLLDLPAVGFPTD